MAARPPKRPKPDYGPGYVDPSKQRVDINVSTGRPSHRGDAPIDPAKQARINSSLARFQSIRDRDPNVTFTSQGPSNFYRLGRDDISQIVATRAPKISAKRDAALRAAAARRGEDPDQFVHDRSEGRIVDEGRGTTPSGRPNRTLKAQYIVDDLIRKYDQGQHNLTIDEIASGTDRQLGDALRAIGAQRPEILKGLSMYLASGPGSGPGKYDKRLMNQLRKHKVPVFTQIYGGRHEDGGWTDAQWSGALDKFRKFREAGYNATPLMSLSDKHIGTGKVSIAEARRRAQRIFNQTGYIPSVWHATSVRSPAPVGMGNAVDQWIRKMRGGKA
jgi:hypothetical protein